MDKMALRILRKLPREKAFYFFTSIGNYTGESAGSLKEFIDKISEVSLKSLEFHFRRGDFEKWIVEVLEDVSLAEHIGKLRGQELTGDSLRIQLHTITLERWSDVARELNVG